MTTQLATITPYEQERDQQARALRNARLGLLLWRIANGLIFAFFAFANTLMRQVQPSWPPPGVERLDATLPLLLSGALLISSLTASAALRAVRSNQWPTFQRSVWATIGLALLFFGGMVVVCTQIPYSGPYSSIIVSMNVFHMLHVLIGAALLAFVSLRAARGAYSAERHWTVEAVIVFWHFVGLMWLFFFAVIYVL
jgi:cytochrome c oxidase subunit 3